MFFIAGISPKTIAIDEHKKLCPVCGLARAYYRRIDHYFTLFFIPLFRVKKGEDFLMCEKCEQEMKEFGFGDNSLQANKIVTCNNCGKKLQVDFIFCPYCGKPKN
ncbi:MAG: zinc ribbon domain-containing protein [Desulfobacterium sp.]|nr:zinc ribbon domain-containing protein [Desulfobacterium sp.]MBU3947161.1 zinc ribbon domain-containing protein [Pseudomonadota bacterium]MBU4034827.1 zinc ribbon domain-containing protein [Pseudomonadota bacterium]